MVETFKPGLRVRYTAGDRGRPEMEGRKGVVIRPVKSRRVVTVQFDEFHCLYDARPANLEID